MLTKEEEQSRISIGLFCMGLFSLFLLVVFFLLPIILDNLPSDWNLIRYVRGYSSEGMQKNQFLYNIPKYKKSIS